jgi:putative transposase
MHSPEFKTKVVLEALREEKLINQIAAENDIHPTLISKWKAEAIDGIPSIFRKETAETDKLKTAYEIQIKELYEQIGKLTIDLDWLKKKSGK